MNLAFPRPGEPIAGTMPPGNEWHRWFQRLWSSLGWNPSHPIWNDLFPSHHEHGGSVNTALDGNIQVFSFSGSATNVYRGSFVLPNDYAKGTDLYPYLAYAGPSGASGNAYLGLGFATGATLSETYTKFAATSLAGGLSPARLDFEALDGASLERGSAIPFTLSRLGATANDTSSDLLYLLGFGLKYRVRGSGQEERFP